MGWKWVVCYLIVGYESLLQSLQGVLRTRMFSIFLNKCRNKRAPGDTGGALEVVPPELPGNHVVDDTSGTVRGTEIIRQQVVIVVRAKYIVPLEMLFGYLGRVSRVAALDLVEQVQGVIYDSHELDDNNCLVVLGKIVFMHRADVMTQPSTQQQTVEKFVVQWSTP